MRLLPIGLLALVLGMSGCAGTRLVIDVVPAEQDLIETVVLDDPHSGWRAAKVAMIDVSGLIVDAERLRLLGTGENPVSRLIEGLRRAEDDDRVRAVLIRINSPGGAVTASDIMYREVVGFRERSGKPVVVLMGDVATSGGYYLACGADEIIAHPTTITGSIGVIMQTINVSEGMRMIGIRADAITSGPNKSIASPFAPMSPEHREILQEVVDELYDVFRSIVVESRPGIAAADLDRVTDGRVVTGRRAAAVGLVDGVGDLHDAFEAAKRRAGLSHAQLVKYHRWAEHVGSPYARAPIDGMQVNLMQLNLGDGLGAVQPGFYYLWDPGVW